LRHPQRVVRAQESAKSRAKIVAGGRTEPKSREEYNLGAMGGVCSREAA
jgi:hypothetical protein